MRDQSNDEINAELIQSQMIQPLEKREVRLPFHYLRTWIFSLLALICLPIGLMLMLIGTDMEANLDQDWEEVTAIVERNDSQGAFFTLDDGSDIEGGFGYTLDYFVENTLPGEIGIFVSACDLFSWAIIPKQEDESFTVWVNPAKATQHSCVPITRDFAILYIALGIVLSVLSALRLLRTFNKAALRR